MRLRCSLGFRMYYCRVFTSLLVHLLRQVGLCGHGLARLSELVSWLSVSLVFLAVVPSCSLRLLLVLSSSVGGRLGRGHWWMWCFGWRWVTKRLRRGARSARVKQWMHEMLQMHSQVV